jgi:hypothetical protein
MRAAFDRRQLGLPPYRLDLLTSISGVGFGDAWEGRLAGSRLKISRTSDRWAPEPMVPPELISIEHLTTALSGRCMIDRELGQGGMAMVYLAQGHSLATLKAKDFSRVAGLRLVKLDTFLG